MFRINLFPVSMQYQVFSHGLRYEKAKFVNNLLLGCWEALPHWGWKYDSERSLKKGFFAHNLKTIDIRSYRSIDSE